MSSLEWTSYCLLIQNLTSSIIIECHEQKKRKLSWSLMLRHYLNWTRRLTSINQLIKSLPNGQLIFFLTWLTLWQVNERTRRSSDVSVAQYLLFLKYILFTSLKSQNSCTPLKNILGITSKCKTNVWNPYCVQRRVFENKVKFMICLGHFLN